MKRKITYLIAALAAIFLTTEPRMAFAEVLTLDLSSSTGWTVTYSGTSGTGSAVEMSKSGITITASSGYWAGDQLRVYKDSSFNITSSIGDMSQIALTYTGSKTGPLSGYTDGTASISPAAASLSSTAGGQARIVQINITYTPSGGGSKHKLYYSASHGSISGVDAGSNYVVSGASIAESATVTLTANPVNGYKFVSWSDGGDNSTLSSTTSNPTTFTMGAADITVTATFEEAWKVTLNSNGIEHDELVVKGQSISLTAPNNIPTGYKYRGWTLSTETPSSLVSTTYTPSENVKLYAVFGIITYGDFEKVSSSQDDWSGRYLIVYESDNKIFDGSLEELDVTNNYQSVTISNNKISKTGTEDYLFTIEKIDNLGNYSIKSASGYYIGKTANSNGLNTSKSTVYSNTISYDGTNKKPIVTSSGSRTLSYNSASDQKRFRYLGTTLIQLYKQAEDDPTGYYISVSAPVTSNITITTPTTISDRAVLDMGSHSLTIGTGGSLIIEDGGQLITSSSVQLTYKKSITSAAKDGGWYTISTPVHTESNTFLTPGSVENLIIASEDNYDFFRYDEASHTWMNYKQSAFNLNVGQGYLYRNNGAELHFAGYNNQATSYNVALSYASTEDKLLGFNLIGNPYPQNITMSDVTVNNEGALSGGYVLSKDGAWSADVAATIAPAQGFLVQIDKTGVTATITKPTGGSKSRANNDYIKFIVANSQHEDAAFALFEEGYGLNKIDHRNSDIPMLYIPKEGHNFAIATMDDNTQSFNLNLKAKTTGKYTLTYKATGNYSYLHVIDRLTGEDVDMLMEGEYSFIASPSDAENRFIVRLEYSNGYENSEDSIFAYQSGSDIIVNGEGELQIFDVMGRRVLTQYVSGVETINLQSHGVYIFKLNEKTQKIVVR